MKGDIVIIKIPYPATPAGKKQWAKQYGTNAYWAGKHWAIRKKDADFWHAITRAAAAQAGVLNRKRIFDSPVAVSFLWNDRLDLDNHSIMGKMILDALKRDVIADDNRRCVKRITHSWHDENYIGVVISEI